MMPTDHCLFVLKYRITFDHYTREAGTMKWSCPTMDMKTLYRNRLF